MLEGLAFFICEVLPQLPPIYEIFIIGELGEQILLGSLGSDDCVDESIELRMRRIERVFLAKRECHTPPLITQHTKISFMGEVSRGRDIANHLSDKTTQNGMFCDVAKDLDIFVPR